MPWANGRDMVMSPYQQTQMGQVGRPMQADMSAMGGQPAPNPQGGYMKPVDQPPPTNGGFVPQSAGGSPVPVQRPLQPPQQPQQQQSQVPAWLSQLFGNGGFGQQQGGQANPLGTQQQMPQFNQQQMGDFIGMLSRMFSGGGR
jgi:hypothetical protein